MKLSALFDQPGNYTGCKITDYSKSWKLFKINIAHQENIQQVCEIQPALLKKQLDHVKYCHEDAWKLNALFCSTFKHTLISIFPPSLHGASITVPSVYPSPGMQVVHSVEFDTTLFTISIAIKYSN